MGRDREKNLTTHFRFEAAVHKVVNKVCYFVADVHTIRMLELFRDLYRPQITKDISRDAVFFACGDDPAGAAKPLTLTGISKAISKTFRRAGIVTATEIGVRKIRESVVTFSRASGLLEREDLNYLADAMSHDEKTASTFYDLSSTLATRKMVKIMAKLDTRAKAILEEGEAGGGAYSSEEEEGEEQEHQTNNETTESLNLYLEGGSSSCIPKLAPSEG